METVKTLFIAHRRGLIEIVFYCPMCEAVNELIGRGTARLFCRECQAFLSGAEAMLELCDATDPDAPALSD